MSFLILILDSPAAHFELMSIAATRLDGYRSTFTSLHFNGNDLNYGKGLSFTTPFEKLKCCGNISFMLGSK